MRTRRVQIILPELTGPQAEAMIELLDELMIAIWDAHENELTNRASRQSHFAHCDQDEDVLVDDDTDDAPF
jgi:hypothetical protein